MEVFYKKITGCIPIWSIGLLIFDSYPLELGKD
jgi:hypothetical protein